MSEMPGRHETLERFFERIEEQHIARIIRLTSLDEVREKSPEYHQALKGGNIPCPAVDCAVPDGGIPEDESAFLKKVRRTADWLRTGERVLVHCGAGIGRTGLFAICTLVALGMSLDVAERAVHEAGSRPEADIQRAFVHRVSVDLADLTS